MIALWLLACSEYTVRDEVPVEPADPPGEEEQDVGEAPLWSDCEAGYEGTYLNLPANHPDVDPSGPADPSLSWADVDWWDTDRTSFERVDTSLDHGPSWWPVDDGLDRDPELFAVRWVTWLRVWEDDEPVTFVVGSSDDLWIDIEGETVYSLPGVHDYEPESVELDLAVGQYPVELRYAHRGGEGGFSFRLVGDHVTLCRPGHEGETR